MCENGHPEQLIIQVKVSVRRAHADLDTLGNRNDDGTKMGPGLYNPLQHKHSVTWTDPNKDDHFEWVGGKYVGQERVRLRCFDCPTDVVLGPASIDALLRQCVLDDESRLDITKLSRSLGSNSP